MDASTRLSSIFYLQVDIVVVEVSVPLPRRPLLLILALVCTVWGLMPGATSVNRVILVSSGDGATHCALTPSMGEPTVEPLMSDKAAVMAKAPEGAMLGDVVGVR